MADKLTLSDFGVFLAEICEFLKKREKTLFDLIVEVEGLKATLTGADAAPFDQAKGKASRRDARAQIARIQQLDAIIARIRGG
jgi:hypothetical protein